MSAKGWPRPFRDYEPERSRGTFQAEKTYRLPDLWILEDNDWLTFQTDRSNACYHERLCAVCGEGMDGSIIMPEFDRKHGRLGERCTSGPGCHPRCAALALKLCPHLQGAAEKDFVAFRYDGPSNGSYADGLDYMEPYEGGTTQVDHAAVAITLGEVKRMAKENPLGLLR